jgi:transcriptional regulator with XRE-family HTH domain
LTDQVRQAIDACGLTRYRLAQFTGVSQPTLSRFMSGERGISLDALDTLAQFLQITIQVGYQPDEQGE